MENSYEKLLVHLLDHQVDFILVGGLAVALNGYPRMTEDVDIWANPDPSNIQALIQCLKRYGNGYAADLEPADFSDEPGAVRIIEEFPIDIFLQMNGLSFAEILSCRKSLPLHGHSLHYLNAEGLIKVKSGSHREKDRLDIDVLRRINAV